MAACFINSKGFGGNNASALLVSPQETRRLLRQRHGAQALQRWDADRNRTEAQRQAYEAAADAGVYQPLYRFGENVLTGQDLEITAETIRLPGLATPVSLRGTGDFSAYRENPPDKNS